MSSNIRELIKTAVEYGVEHLGMNMAATTVDTVRSALRKRYRTQLSLAAWRGYANLLLDRTKYVSTWKAAANKHRSGWR
jgi:predicted aldo/keto reductase-like oxidoreductase